MNLTKAQLLQIIEKAAKDGITEFSLETYPLLHFWYTAVFNNIAETWDRSLVPPCYIVPDQIGRLTKLTKLDLSRGGFVFLSEKVGDLTNLTTLDLSSNKLSALPWQICRVTNLTTLNLNSNEFSKFPSGISNLTNLTTLDLSSNKLSALPAEIGDLTNLTTLNLYWNYFTVLPPEIGRLTKLTNLDLGRTNLQVLPPEIGQLCNLRTLNLAGTQITKLPPEMGRLSNLETLNLTGFLGVFGHTPLVSPSPEIIAKGTAAILAYLRDLLEGGRRQWRAKLVIVGEPRAGKTSLLRRLRGEGFSLTESTTHGIENHSLKLRHPSRAEEMELNAWDFGGQHIYHATHRFFLTDGALFLLVWDSSRDSHLSGKLEYWLENIRARAPGARVVLVATHAEDRAADLRDDLDSRYPGMIVGRFAVSNKNEIDQGRAALQENLRRLAAELPRIGELWPTAWLNAAEALTKRPEDHLSPGAARKVLAGEGVTDDTAANTLLDWLHERGDILYFRLDPELNDLVLLKPHWVSEKISRVLDSPEVRAAGGVFTLKDRQTVWRDVDEPVRDHLMRLMEQFDLSYRAGPERWSPSLVVECLPLTTPAYEKEWEAAGKGESARELALTFELSGSGSERLKILPPGIPGWFIARTHRFSTGTHWRQGTLLADTPGRKHLGLVRAEEGWVRLAVRGPNPLGFFTELRSVLENTLQRYPGLTIRRTVPCSGHNGRPCPHQFRYERLQELESKGQPEVECGESGERLPIRRLLYGMDEAIRDGRSQWQVDNEAKQAARHEALLAEMKSVRESTADIPQLLTKYHVETTADLGKVLEGQDRLHRLGKEQDRHYARLLDLVGKVDAQTSTPTRNADREREVKLLLECQRVLQDEFTKLYRRDQAALDAKRPRTFVLQPSGGNRWWKEKLFGQPWELQLFCEQPTAWHPQEKGRYTIRRPPGWMRKMAPYLRYLCWGLRASLPVVGVVLPLAGPAAAAAGFTTATVAAESAKAFKEYLKDMQELTELLADAGSAAPEVGAIEPVEAPAQGHGEILRQFWVLLDELDGSLQPGGLQKVLTREGDCLWLCDEHAAHHRT